MSGSDGTSQFDDTRDESRLVDIHAFGRRFENYPAGLAEDLISLEREGAIYSHFADEAKGPTADGLWEFRYYRIPFTPLEIVQFVEASVAHQAFHEATLRGADFETALAAISDPGIAARVREYDGEDVVDGITYDTRGCPASFYPDGIEALLSGHCRDRYEELPATGSERDRLAQLIQILNNFPLVARLLRGRQHSRPDYIIENEYDVQDLAYACIRAVFEDAKREEWTPQRAGSSKRIDVTIPSIAAVVEAKFVRDRAHSRRVADELRIDFECYHDRPECRHLLALVVDPANHIADPAQFGADLSGLRQKGEHVFEVSVLVR